MDEGRTTNELGQPVGEPLPDWTPRRYPAPGMLEGRRCRVEPLAVRHIDSLFAALSADESGRSWTYMGFGPFDTRDDFVVVIEELIENPRLVSMAITDPAGRALGFASYARIEPAIGSVEVGGIGYRRYEWKCDALNAASIAAAKRLGFAYEGTWRNATTYKGRNRDTAWFAMTDRDWAALGPAFEQWLAPSNFDGGRQRSSLSEQTARVRAALE